MKNCIGYRGYGIHVRATPQILEFMEESKSPKMALLLLLTKPTKRSNKIYSLALVGLLRSPQNKRGFNDENVIRNSTFLFCPFGKKNEENAKHAFKLFYQQFLQGIKRPQETFLKLIFCPQQTFSWCKMRVRRNGDVSCGF